MRLLSLGWGRSLRRGARMKRSHCSSALASGRVPVSVPLILVPVHARLLVRGMIQALLGIQDPTRSCPQSSPCPMTAEASLVMPTRRHVHIGPPHTAQELATSSERLAASKPGGSVAQGQTAGRNGSPLLMGVPKGASGAPCARAGLAAQAKHPNATVTLSMSNPPPVPSPGDRNRQGVVYYHRRDATARAGEKPDGVCLKV